jgi:hypothetical protein
MSQAYYRVAERVEPIDLLSIPAYRFDLVRHPQFCTSFSLSASGAS